MQGNGDKYATLGLVVIDSGVEDSSVTQYECSTRNALVLLELALTLHHVDSAQSAEGNLADL